MIFILSPREEDGTGLLNGRGMCRIFVLRLTETIDMKTITPSVYKNGKRTYD